MTKIQNPKQIKKCFEDLVFEFRTCFQHQVSCGEFRNMIFEFIRYTLLLLVFFSLLYIACAVLLFEALYSAGGIDIFLLARVERMAHRTYLCMDFFRCAAGLKCIPTATVNYHVIVLWMYLFFHN